MNYTITSNTSFRHVALGALLALAFGVMGLASTAFAATPVFNTDPADCPTVMVARYQNEPSQVCWNTSDSASDGQYVNVAVYYHNTGTGPASGINVFLQDPGDNYQSSFSFTGGIRYGNQILDSGTGQLFLSEPSRLVLEGVYYYPNSGSNQSLGNPNGILANGYNPGTVGTGWSNQAVIKFKFRVDAEDNGGGCTNGCGNEDLDILTLPATDVIDDSARLRGQLDSNGQNAHAWFVWGEQGDGFPNQTSHQYLGNVSGSQYSSTLNNLDEGTYQFKACAEGDNGNIICGGVKYFTIGDGDNGCNNGSCGNNAPSVTTNSASSIDSDSATLRGTLDDDGGDNDLDTWFEWGTSQGNLSNTVSAQTVDDDDDDFSRNIGGLQENRIYYFRACAENDSDQDCGSVKSFRTDRDTVVINDDEDRPDVTTLSAIGIGSTSASIDGFFSGNGCAVDTWFQYGTSQSLGSQTARVNRGNTSGSMAQAIFGLAQNTTYYYRAVAENCEGISYGNILSFRTTNGVVANPPTVVTTVVGGGGGSFIRLMITNNQDDVSAGEDLTYDVTWENISGRRLEDLLLEVNFPTALRVVDIGDGELDRQGNRVIIEIESLEARETGETSIDTKVRGTLRNGDPVVARAIIAFENPLTEARENAIGYDSDEYDANGGLGAFLFGAGFFPTTLAGWLIIILIILGIIYVARRYMRNQVVGTVAGASYSAPAPANPGEYTPYRPMPRQ